LDFDGIVAGLDSEMIGKNSEEMVKLCGVPDDLLILLRSWAL
jgi:hypothetical protein